MPDPRTYFDAPLEQQAEAALEAGRAGPEGLEITYNEREALLYRVITDAAGTGKPSGVTSYQGERMVYAIGRDGFVHLLVFNWLDLRHVALYVRDSLWQDGRTKLAGLIHRLASTVE